MLLQALLQQFDTTPVSEKIDVHDMHRFPNLVGLGAWAIHLQQHLQKHPTAVLFLENRQEVEHALQFLKIFGVEDCVYYPTPN